MKIVFFSGRFKNKRASHRLRGELMANTLANMGYNATCGRSLEGVDATTTVVFLKNSQPTDILEAKRLGAHTIYDLCDNKFDEKEEYEPCCAAADAITVNSEQMGISVRQTTGRNSTVIPDPAERPVLAPCFAPNSDIKLLWFGSSASLKFVPWVELWQQLESQIKNYQFTMVTAKADRLKNKMIERQRRGVFSGVNFDRLHFVEWDWELQGQLLASTDIVFIPVIHTNYRTDTKSANRLIDGLMSGRFVVTTPLASYVEFEAWTWQQQDLMLGIRWAREHPGKTLAKIQAGQQHTIENYSPVAIAQRWLGVMRG